MTITVYVVDTNLLFSAICNTAGNIAELIASQEDYDIKLIAPTCLQEEMDTLIPRLLSQTGLSLTIINRLIAYMYERVEFVEDKHIPIPHYARAAEIVREIDQRDLHFVALSSFKNEYLLTGDTKLYNGLIAKGYGKVINFQQLKIKHNIK